MPNRSVMPRRLLTISVIGGPKTSDSRINHPNYSRSDSLSGIDLQGLGGVEILIFRKIA